MSSNNNTVLITGGTGFIGSYVARALLDHGRQVCLADIREPGSEAKFVLGDAAGKIPVEQCSIDNWARLAEIVKKWKPSQIVHIGGIVDTLYLLKNPVVALKVNTEGTVNVLECARLFDVDRVVNFSSIGVLPLAQYQPIDVKHPIILAKSGPASGAYGAAKIAAEAFCFAYHQAFGLDFRTIRPSAAYGFGMQWHSANYMKQFVEPAVKGEKVRLPSGGAMPRDYTHVRDIASLTLAVLNAPDDADRVFYAATGEPLITATECAKLVSELVPGSDIQIGHELSEEDQHEIGFRGVLSIDNAKKQLGWKPTYASLRDGVSEYIATYRAYLAGNK